MSINVINVIWNYYFATDYVEVFYAFVTKKPFKRIVYKKIKL